MTKKKPDYFAAKMEDDEIALKPYCGVCDIMLDEGYYCNHCKRQCKCTHFKCEDNDCYGKIFTLISQNEYFKNYTIEITIKP